MNDGNPAVTAPPAERLHLPEGLGAAKTPNRELHYRRAVVDPFQPGAGAAQARDVYVPAPAIEPSDEFDHLSLGSARIEARHHNREGHRGHLRHAAI